MRHALTQFRLIVAVALIAGTTAGQTLLWTITGPPSSQFGWSVAGGGDVDGDGFSDLVVGAPGANAASIYSGYDGSLLHTEAGSGGSFGASVAILGDANGDGLADVLIGAPTTTMGGVFVGSVRYVLGGSFIGGTGWGPPTQMPFLGFLTTDFGFGAHVAAAGDLNGDGIADAIVTRPGRCQVSIWDPFNCYPVQFQGYSYAGDATAYVGGTFALLHQIPGSTGEPFARVAAGMGDVNGDGLGDFVLLSGGTTPLVSNCYLGSQSTCPGYDLRLSMRSGATGAQFWAYSSVVGQSLVSGRNPCLAAVGDLNGDQRSDLLMRVNVQLPGGPSPPVLVVTTILSGLDGSVLMTWSENLSSNAMQLSAAGVGDVDGDGIPDYATGECIHGGINRVRVYSGATHALIHTFNGASNSGLGSSVAGLGDLNGDGRGDFAIGSPGFSGPAPFVQVYSGASLPVASVVSLGGGCGAGGAPVLTMSPPVIGTSPTIAVAGAPYPATGILVTSAVPAAPIILPGGCPVFVDPPSLAAFAFISIAPAGDWSLTLPVPNTPTISGLSVALTAGLWPASGSFAASNTVAATVGY